MKILAISGLFSALLAAQTPVQVTPGAPAIQSPAATPTPVTTPVIPPDTVVAEVAGKKYTAAEMDAIIKLLPPQYQPMARSQPQMLQQVLLMQRLAADAEKAGIDQRSPFKEQLEMARLQLLSTAQLSDVNNTLPVTDEDQDKYYKDNQEKFKQVKVRVIYVSFSPTPDKPGPDGKKGRSEAEAKAKLADLQNKLAGGADFGKLAHDNSDEASSAAKDGEFGVIKQSSTYPQPIKSAVFALKQGEVSAPVREGPGYYLIRADEVGVASFNDSEQEIAVTLRKLKFDEWLNKLREQYNVKIENQSYFGPRAPAAVQPVH